MISEYKEIKKNVLEVAYRNAFSVENREVHESDGELTYIGSTQEGERIRDYYIDRNGKYWYGNRARVKGRIISYEEYIFGHVIRKGGRKSAKSNH